MSELRCLPELLCRVDFPLYSMAFVSPRHLLVGGGGGAAKTGVKNGFEIFELTHDGRATRAISVTRFETSEFAAMNLTTSWFDQTSQSVDIAVGHDHNCQIYKLQMTTEKKGPNGDVANGTVGKNGLSHCNKIIFNVTPGKKVQTDYNMPEPYQKVVRMSPDNKYLATGGDDGYLRIWTYPDLFRTFEIEAHDKEIDDIDFSPDNTKIVTIGKDRRAFIWDVKKGKKHAEMGWDPPKGLKYLYKRVRFGRVEGDSRKYKVFCISNPVGASKPPSYVQRFDGKTFTLEQNRPFHGGSLSALAVSDNGNFVATGSMFDGTVEIFTAFNLNLLKRVDKSHATFITGLEFLPTTEETEILRGFSEASLVSISVDHQVCIHHIPKPRTISMGTATFILVVFLVFTFIFCSYLGL